MEELYDVTLAADAKKPLIVHYDKQDPLANWFFLHFKDIAHFKTLAKEKILWEEDIEFLAGKTLNVHYRKQGYSLELLSSTFLFDNGREFRIVY